MPRKTIYSFIRLGIALVWLINGLLCKVINLVPRHQQIVERITGLTNGRVLTFCIGIMELLMAIWILSGFYRRFNAGLQIVLIAVMNTIEFFMARDLLLWHQFNSLFALLLICIIYFNEFYLYYKVRGTIRHV